MQPAATNHWQQDIKEMKFPTDYASIQERINAIDPVGYGKTRNYLDGDVTHLSPYISRGVISTKQVLQSVLERGFHPKKIEKFIQELAWRDYWQQVWVAKKDLINEDLKNEQTNVDHHEMVTAVNEASTGIEAIDAGIQDLYKTGYMHNHLRMYTAAITCNMGFAHWRSPAQWMYYHLFDGDWASNALSWQWVAGANANKKYLANQDNINKYCGTKQCGTFLDVPYETFDGMEVPNVLKPSKKLALSTPLPESKQLQLIEDVPILLYNWYNLDPEWKKTEDANRVLLLEPSVFKQYPISANSIAFCLQLARNIDNIQVFVGEFNDLIKHTGNQTIYFKEHPLNKHYQGVEEKRDWMFAVTGYFPSFFGFWNKCKKSLK